MVKQKLAQVQLTAEIAKKRREVEEAKRKLAIVQKQTDRDNRKAEQEKARYENYMISKSKQKTISLVACSFSAMNDCNALLVLGVLMALSLLAIEGFLTFGVDVSLPSCLCFFVGEHRFESDIDRDRDLDLNELSALVF